MVRINRKYIVAFLLTQAPIFMKAYAENEVHGTNHAPNQEYAVETNPLKVLVEEMECKLREKDKDKPFEFSAGISLSAFYDLQKYGAKSKFAPGKLKDDDKKNPKLFDAFADFNVSITKEMHILGYPLTFNCLIEKEEGKTSLDLSNFYVENKWFKLGKAPGNFCSYLPNAFRYAANQIAFKHDLGDGFSYTLAIEEAQGATIRTKEKEEAEKVEVDIKTKDGKDAKVKTIENKTSEAKLFTSTRMPQLAFAANVAYKQDWGNIQLSGLGTVVEYSYSTPDTIKHSYKHQPMFGAALSGKYIFVHNEEYEDKEETFASAHVKWRSGLGGYHGEAGGLPENINSNFCISKNETKIITNLQSIGFGVSAKHVWTKNFSSSISSSMLLLLNSNKIEDVDHEKKYNNAFMMKLTPISFNIAKNFTLAPSYNLGIGNILHKGDVKASTIQRIGFDVSYDF
jgi:hypothetical protein